MLFLGEVTVMTRKVTCCGLSSGSRVFCACFCNVCIDGMPLNMHLAGAAEQKAGNGLLDVGVPEDGWGDLLVDAVAAVRCRRIHCELLHLLSPAQPEAMHQVMELHT